MSNQDNENKLFPVFLKLETMKLLLVGAGNVGLEKLEAVVNNSPETAIKVVATEVFPEFRAFAQKYNVTILERAFVPDDLKDQDIVILATNNIELDAEIKASAKKRSLLVNVADKPELCDFYLCSIVKKGHLKIGISTNGKSPTIAKRIKEILIEVIPEDVHKLLNNMQKIRNKLRGDFAYKVDTLNKLTTDWKSDNIISK